MVRNQEKICRPKTVPGEAGVGSIDYSDGRRQYRKSSGPNQLTMAEKWRGDDVTF
jgi:hypothetical protein